MLGDVIRGLSKNVFGGQATGGKTTPIGRKSPIELAKTSREDKLMFRQQQNSHIQHQVVAQ